MGRILVTGGSGFLGANLCVRLIADGNRVICVDNNCTGRLTNVAGLLKNKNFRFLEQDIIEPFSIEEKIDQIYNFACPASPAAYQGKNAIFTTKTCVIGALNMLQLAKQHGAVILQASTSEVYGDPTEHPQKETYSGNVNPIGIRSCYDEGKRCAESIFFDYHREEGVPIRIVRIFNTYGPNMAPDDGRVVSNFICQALEQSNITIHGDGSQTRSFCYVDDLIEIIVRVMNGPRDFTGPVNIGNPSEFTINELAKKILDKIPTPSKIIHLPLPKDDPARRNPDISLARKEFEWFPKITLDEGLDRTIDYFKKILDP
ncbi:MAG: SDR family oxidoreductase [Puniceicoccales bacterium]|jgi:UDP-glucuronate decarboxylase|nr:SDR family oxidoreductase [Puniceicoccales bacterium]